MKTILKSICILFRRFLLFKETRQRKFVKRNIVVCFLVNILFLYLAILDFYTILSLYPCISGFPYTCIPISLYLCIPVSLYSYIPVSLNPCIHVSMYYCITVLLYPWIPCIPVSLYPCIPVSLYLCIPVMKCPLYLDLWS